jgi:hypothetical protein
MIPSIYTYLDEKDKSALEHTLNNHGIPQDSINSIYEGKLLTEFIAYQNLSREEKITICIILIKTLLKRRGAFIRTPDHSAWLSTMLKWPPTIGDHRCERELFQFINIANFLHFQHISKGDYMIDLAIKPLSSMCGAAIAGFCIFPVLESICRRRSPLLTISGIAKEDIHREIRGVEIRKKKGRRVNDIQHDLLLVEENLDDYLSKSLRQLDADTGIYHRIKDARNQQLHGEFLGRADSVIFNLFLSLFYL